MAKKTDEKTESASDVTAARLEILLELALSHHSDDRKAAIRERWDAAGQDQDQSS